MKRYFDRDDFSIALLLAIYQLADPWAESLGYPPPRMSSGTTPLDVGDDWSDDRDGD